MEDMQDHKADQRSRADHLDTEEAVSVHQLLYIVSEICYFGIILCRAGCAGSVLSRVRLLHKYCSFKIWYNTSMVILSFFGIFVK